jgi:hypothetical protein
MLLGADGPLLRHGYDQLLLERNRLRRWLLPQAQHQHG